MIKLLAKPIVDQIHTEVRTEAKEFAKRFSRTPKLSVVLVGDDPASVIYTRKKGETAVALGMEHETIVLPSTSQPAEVKAVVDRLNQDPTVDGILIQRPLPAGFHEREVLYWVTPEKDVDGFHPMNAGRLFLGLPGLQPCTPAGIMKLLRHYQINPRGMTACVIGRSSIVGKPMGALLMSADATVLHCHSKTRDLKSITRLADLLIVAAGKPGLIDGSHVKSGAVVVDVGIHRTAAGKVVGDVDYESVAKVADALTPVPGGVGPMTIAMLMRNTILAATSRQSGSPL